MAGEVTGLYIEEGSVVSAGETTAQIIDMSSLEAELKVDEYDVAAVTPACGADFRFGDRRAVHRKRDRIG